MNYKKILKNELKKRKYGGVTELAKEIGCSRYSIYKWMNGSRTPLYFKEKILKFKSK
jgi:hypothetical protein